MPQTISHHAALIYTMVLVSASDGEMSDNELEAIGDVVRKFPIFHDFDQQRLVQVAEECSEILADEEGLDAVMGLIRQALPDKLRETAYAAAIEVAAADEVVHQEELQMLEHLRQHLGLDRLRAGAIEHSARVRHRTL